MITGKTNTLTRPQSLFVWSAACILLVTALAKIGSSFGKQHILDFPDPIFGISFRNLMLLASVLELTISAYCVFSTNKVKSLHLILWFTSCLAIYRIGLFYIGWNRPCTCMGGLIDEIHISAEHGDLIAKFLLAYLFMGSAFILLSSKYSVPGLLYKHRSNLMISALLILSYSLSNCFAFAAPPNGSWQVFGKVMDIRSVFPNGHFTNTLSIDGISSNGDFLINVTPIRTEDEIAESIGWDGTLLRIIQRFPKEPGKGLARDQSIAYVEPLIFSRYATDASAPILMALADTNSLMDLKTGAEPIILGFERSFPEEKNSYSLTYNDDGSVNITATAPGRLIEAQGDSVVETPIAGFENGFIRWTMIVTNALDSKPDMPHIFFCYERFYPLKDRTLFQFRTVSGNIYFMPDNSGLNIFQPKISESKLVVRDYSSRKELDPWLKGQTDYCLLYVLTNNSWTIDQSWATEQVTEVRDALKAKPLPPEIILASVRESVPPSPSKRALIIGLMLAISAGFFCYIVYEQYGGRAKTKQKQ